MSASTAQQVYTLLHYLQTNQQPPFVVLFYPALLKVGLDYTPSSIERLERLLNQLVNKNYGLEKLLLQQGGANFFLMVGAYLGDYLAKSTDSHITWLDFHETTNELNQLNQQHNANFHLPSIFDSSLQAKIGDSVLYQPFKAIAGYFLQEGNMQDFIADMQTVIFQDKQIDVYAEPHQVCKQYLAKLRTGKLLDHTIGFFEQINDIVFDYSQQSLSSIDQAIIKIKDKFNFSEKDYDEIIAQPSYQMFFYLLGFYIGTTIAKLAKISVKWVNHEQMVDMLSGHDFLNCIEHSFVFLVDNQYHTPIFVLTNHLFDITNEFPKLTAEFSVNLQQQFQGNLKTFPLHRQDLNKTFDLPTDWQLAIRAAGFLLASNLLQLYDGGQIEPALFHTYLTDSLDDVNLQDDSNQGEILSIIADDSNQAIDEIYQQLNHNPNNLPFLVASYDMYANLSTGRSDAVAIEIRSYQQPKLNIQFILPYRCADHPQGFAIYPLVNNQVNVPNDLANLVNCLYQASLNFKTSLIDGDFWQSYYLDGTDLLAESPMIKQQKSPHFSLVDKIEIPVLSPRIDEIVTESSQMVLDDVVKPSVSADNLIHEVAPFDYDGIFWHTLILGQEIQRLNQKQRDYLQVVVPDTLIHDELFRQVEAMPSLYRRGHVVWAALVQANPMLDEPIKDVTNFDYLASHASICDVVYDPTGQANVRDLQVAAKRLLALKNKPISSLESDQVLYATHLKEEKSRLFGFPYPKSFGDKPYRLSTIWVWQNHLPTGMFADKVFPIIIDDSSYHGRVMILPARFWEKELYQFWLDKTYQRFGFQEDLDVLPKIQALEKQQSLFPTLEVEHRLFPKLHFIFPHDKHDEIDSRRFSEQLDILIPLPNTPTNAEIDSTSPKDNALVEVVLDEKEMADMALPEKSTIAPEMVNEFEKSQQNLSRMLSNREKDHKTEKKAIFLFVGFVLILIVMGLVAWFAM